MAEMQILQIRVFQVGNNQVILHVYGVNPQGFRFMLGSTPMAKTEVRHFLEDLPNTLEVKHPEPGNFTGGEGVPF